MSLETLRTTCDTPEVSNVQPFRYSLDGGGREIVEKLIKKEKATVLLEIGCFLCGSVAQWLDTKKDLTVIGVDPWEGNWFLRKIEEYLQMENMRATFDGISDVDAFRASLKENGDYIQALANVQKYGDRFIPIRGYSPDVLSRLVEHDVSPDIVYIDANKLEKDLEYVHKTFPEARICGDDWTWNAAEGFPMRRAVESFSRQYGYDITAVRATWVLTKR